MTSAGSSRTSQVLRDRYRIEAAIGAGGMGSVYLAEDLRLSGRRCAVKEIILPNGLTEETRKGLLKAFHDEASLLARLDHPGLPGVSDHFEEDGSAFLVMDYVPGQDLKSLLDEAMARRRELDADHIARWAEKVGEVLQYLHSQEPAIVHRDIKPANIKLLPDGQLRLVDFGLARSIDEAGGATMSVLSGAGSRAYQALEQYGDNSHVDIRSDIYAFGATLYHLYTSRAPQPAQERFLNADAMPRVHELRKDLSEELGDTIAAAMALHPRERPSSIGIFCDRLSMAQSSSDKSGSPRDTGLDTRQHSGQPENRARDLENPERMRTSWIGWPSWKSNLPLALLTLSLLAFALYLSLI